MRLLVLGGTRFLGRAFVESALRSGHSVTLFHRGRTGADLFPEVERIVADRDGGLDALAGRAWDAAIDTCGYVPRIVKQSVKALQASVEHYTFVSTISVYADGSQLGITEESPLATTDNPDEEAITNTIYGPLKVLCEQAVIEGFGEHAFIPRPGLIVGPWDPSDRFTYWPVTVARGGEMLAPAPMEEAIQVIDARDLGDWMLAMIERKTSGIYNAVGPSARLCFGDLIDSCLRISGSQTNVNWVPHDFLLKQGLKPWADLPLWIPPSSDEARLIEEVAIGKAIASGLKLRPLDETVRDTLSWHRDTSGDAPLKAGISPDRQAEILKLWHSL